MAVKKPKETENIESGHAEAAPTDALEMSVVSLNDADAPTPEEVQTMVDSTGMAGEFSASDINWPRVQFVQKTSKVVEVEAFRFCDIILAGEVRIGDPVNAFEFVPVGVRKFYEEHVPFVEKRTPQRWATEAQANAAGFSTKWVGDQRAAAEPKAVVAMLVKMPVHAIGKKGETADADFDAQTCFPLEYAEEGDETHNGYYAMAIMELKGTTYTSVAKPLITALMQPKFAGKISTATFKLKSLKKVNGENTFASGICSLLKVNSDKFAAWANSILGG